MHTECKQHVDQDVQRPDLSDDAKAFSQVLGIHTLPWDSSERQRLLAKFNDMADVARSAARGYIDGEVADSSTVRWLLSYFVSLWCRLEFTLIAVS